MGLDIWRNPWIGRSIFEQMDREFAEAEDMLSRMFRTVREMGPSIVQVQRNIPITMAIR